MERISDILIEDLKANPENVVKLKKVVERVLGPWESTTNELFSMSDGNSIQTALAYVRKDMFGRKIAVAAPGYPMWTLICNGERIKSDVTNRNGAEKLAMDKLDEKLKELGYDLL